jgi:hypothetical protein
MYSFRAMKHATAMAGNSITEKSEETHAAALRVLNGGGAVTADDMFAEINREQQILVAKKALVGRQKSSIADSGESLKRLKKLIDENKMILIKNERALRRGSDDLLRLISKYQYKLKAGLYTSFGRTSAQGTTDTPLRSRPHHRAAAMRKDPVTGVVVKDTTKSIQTVIAEKNAASPAKFSQIHESAETEAEADAEVEAVTDADIAAAVAEEEESDAESEEESEDESEEEESDESEEESEDEAESESESESDESEDSESESEEEEDSEEEESQSDSFVSMTASALPGLAPPPKFETADD